MEGIIDNRSLGSNDGALLGIVIGPSLGLLDSVGWWLGESDEVGRRVGLSPNSSAKSKLSDVVFDAKRTDICDGTTDGWWLGESDGVGRRVGLSPNSSAKSKLSDVVFDAKGTDICDGTTDGLYCP